jgi:hypothetical protein
MQSSKYTPMGRAAVLLMFLGAIHALRAEEEPAKKTLKYKVLMKGKKVGWANAFIDTLPDFVKVTLTWKVKAKVAGMDVKMSSKTVAKYNAKRKVMYFNIQGERPKGTIHTVGKRSGNGYSITTVDGDKSKQIFIDDKSYDCVSLEPALWSGPVGTTKKLRLLFAARGEVGSAAVSIIGREKKTLFGREAQVTHYKIKAALGSVEEWRLDDGVLIRSYLSAPVGKITIELVTEP